MDEEEYNWKYMNLRVLKSVQDFIKKENTSTTAVYPINVPDDLLYQVLKLEGPDNADQLIGHIFKLGLTFWSEKLFNDVFGSERSLEEFIALVKERNIKTES
jgi:hypothetical protein